jgi:transcriptional antiterminator NusG
MREGWVALQVRSKSESRVELALRSKGYECFVPRLRTQHCKSSLVCYGSPLFPGYVFCYITTLGQGQACGLAITTPGVLRLVSFGQTPVIIDEKEIAAIKQAVESHCSIGPHPFLTTGEQILVVRGPLYGITGVLVRFKNSHRVVLSLSLLQRSMFVEVDRADLVPAKRHIQIPSTAIA